MRNVFLRLTELGEGIEDTRRRVAVEELVPEGASPEEVQALLDRLAEARLVTLGEGTAEVAHEVLIREWPTLRAWLEEDRAGIRLHRQLDDAARLWDAGGREAGDLYRGTRLAAAVEWAQANPDALNATERAFLDASVAESERERRAQLRANRRLRVLLAGVGLLLVAAVIAGVLALRESDQARGAARTADAQRLGAQALIDDRLERSLLLAQAGRELDDSVATRGYLLSALVRRPAAIGVIQGDFFGVASLALSSDDRILAVGGFNGTVALFDARTRERIGRPLQVGRPPGTEILSLDFSPDGRFLAVSGLVGEPPGSPRVKLIEVATRKVVRQIDPGAYPRDPSAHTFVEARFTADGRALVVSVATDGSKEGPFPAYLRRYDARTGRPLGRAVPIGRGITRPATSVRSARDRLLVTGFEATFIVDAKTLRVLRRVPVGAWSTGISPDGRTVALGEEDGSVAILDLRTGERRTLSGRHEDRVQGLEFTPDGRTLATKGDDGKILIWDLSSGTVRETLTGHTGPIVRLIVAGDGRTLYTGGLDDRTILWDIAGDRRLARPFARPFQKSGLPQDYPPPLAISPSGPTVAAGLPDGGVRLYDAGTLRPLPKLPGLEDEPVWMVAYSPDGRTMAVAGERGTVEMRDAATGRRLRSALRGSGASVQAMAFSLDGDRLAVADLDGTLRLQELETGKVRRAPRLSDFPIHLSFSPDGDTLAIGLGPSGVELRDSRSLRTIARLPNRAGDSARWVRFSPDGRLLAVSAFEGYTQLWEVAGRRRTGPPLSGHEGYVLNAEFSPDGRMLATSGDDGTVILWDIESRRALGTLPGPPGWTSARFTPDGHRLFVLRDSGAAQRWETSPDAWSRHACAVAGRELRRAEWEELVPDQDYRPVCS